MQNAIHIWGLLGKIIYFQIGLGITLQQLALLLGQDFIIYYKNVILYQNMARHFLERFNFNLFWYNL